MTDFEKLLFVEGYIKELKLKISQLEFKIGELQSEKDELFFLLKKEKPENDKLRKYKVKIKNERLKKLEYKRKYERCFNELVMLKINNNYG